MDFCCWQLAKDPLTSLIAFGDGQVNVAANTTSKAIYRILDCPRCEKLAVYKLGLAI